MRIKILDMRNVILFVLCLALSSFLLKAQALIKDTTISTDIVSLPVYGFTSDCMHKTIKYSFMINWAHFDLLDVVTDSNTSVLNNEIKYSYDWESHLLVVTIDSIKPHFDGVLFNIVIRILPRVDYYPLSEIFEITPMEVVIMDTEGSSSINLGNKTAKIKLNYVSSNLTYRSDVSLNYPNPFLYETIVLFSLLEQSDVNIDIYNTLGVLIQSIPGIGDAFTYEIFDSKHNIVPITESNTLSKDLYGIRLIVNHSQLSQGTYYLVVRIGDMCRTIRMGIN